VIQEEQQETEASVKKPNENSLATILERSTTNRFSPSNFVSQGVNRMIITEAP